jgi:phospholipid transport system substrate-binding protein
MTAGISATISKRPRPSKFGRKAVGLAVLLALAAWSNPGSASAGPAGETVQGLYNSLLVTMRNASTLGASGRYAQIAPVIRRSFDLPIMTRLSVGPAWASLTPAQQQQVTDSYGRYVSAIYADRFDSYHGQRLTVTGEEPVAGGILVRSTIIKANGEPVEVDYMMRQEGGTWLISDIYLDGTISEIATRRSEFAGIVRSQGVDGLVAALNRKADMLTGTTASAD